MPRSNTPQAAVVIAICQDHDEYYIPLTQRVANLTYHASEICLPGGLQDISDLNLEQTAKREFEEEMGIASHFLQIKGALKEESTSKNICVQPYWGILTTSQKFKIEPNEVEELILLPLAVLQQEAFIPNTRYPTFTHHLALVYQDKFIWGITATILHHFTRAIIGHSSFQTILKELIQEK